MSTISTPIVLDPPRNLMQVVLGVALFFASLSMNAAPLFDDHATLEVELAGPITTFINSETKEDEFPFALTVNESQVQVAVRLRGNSRLRVCEFPPMRWRFISDDIGDTEFVGQSKLKLVTHCQNNDRGEQTLLKEYLAYRIFNELSDLSYRVRLLRIRYSDTDGKLKKTARHRYGFLIESDDGFSARSAISEAEVAGISRSAVVPQQAALVYIFQYMIGNTDWSIVTADTDDHCCHNIDLYASGAQFALVPYDFDLSGIVSARYAKPDPSLRIRNVRQRRYRGYCIPSEYLQAALQRVLASENAILKLPAKISGLSQKESRKASNYLRKFFDEAADSEKLLSRFERRCL